MKVIQNLTVGGTGVFAGNVSVPNGTLNAHAVNLLQLNSAVGALVAPAAEIVTVDFGVTYTDKKEVILTGKTWVTASSSIIAQVMTPAGMHADEMYLYRFHPVISDLVVGVGYTLTVYTETEYSGIITVMIIAT